MILGVPSAVQQDVGRLEVAVDDAAPVGVVHGPGQRLDQLGAASAPASGVPSSRSARLPPSTNSSAKYGRPVVLADLVDLDDVGVLQAGDGLGLGPEAAGGLGPGVLAGQDHLEGDEAVEPDLPGLVDDAHAAAAQLAEDLVAGDLGEGMPAPISPPAQSSC